MEPGHVVNRPKTLSGLAVRLASTMIWALWQALGGSSREVGLLKTPSTTTTLHDDDDNHHHH